MIEAIKGSGGKEQALCKCHDCAAEAIVAALHGNTRVQGRGGVPVRYVQNEGQVITKLQGLGWSFVRNRLRCPKCEANRKEAVSRANKLFDPYAAMADIQKEKHMAENVTQLRQPTPKQKREIISILELVYDDDAKRYKGSDTDLTVAETIGGGVLFGWVAAIREEMFGPDGGNEELEAIKSDLSAWMKAADAKVADMQKALDAFKAERAKVATIHQRLEAWNKTVGPKAVRT